MKSLDVGTVKFFDSFSQQDGVAIIRLVDGHIALSLSLQTDGDVEAVLSPEVASTIAQTLLRAVQKRLS